MTSSSSSASHVRLMCSFGGRILPRPHDHLLRYVGGESRIVSVPRTSTFASLLSLLSNIAPNYSPSDPPTIKYQLPHEDLDALISLTCDEDVDNMMHELDRLLSSSSSSSSSAAPRNPRLRLFLFPPSSSSSASEPFGSVLDAGADGWFLDALNGVATRRTAALERLRSEVSSVVSEVPDYLFGLDDVKSVADSPRYSSISSPISDFKLAERKEEVEEKPDPVPVFYMPAPVHAPVQFVHSLGGPVPVQFAPPVHGAAPGPVYMGGAYGYGAPTGGGSMRNPSYIPVYDPAGGAPAVAGGQLRFGYGSASQ